MRSAIVFAILAIQMGDSSTIVVATGKAKGSTPEVLDLFWVNNVIAVAGHKQLIAQMN